MDSLATNREIERVATNRQIEQLQPRGKYRELQPTGKYRELQPRGKQRELVFFDFIEQRWSLCDLVLTFYVDMLVYYFTHGCKLIKEMNVPGE